MEQKMLKEVKRGEFFTLRPVEEPDEGKVLVRGEYDRSEGKYECHHFDDANNYHWYKGTRLVWVGFTF